MPDYPVTSFQRAASIFWKYDLLSYMLPQTLQSRFYSSFWTYKYLISIHPRSRHLVQENDLILPGEMHRFPILTTDSTGPEMNHIPPVQMLKSPFSKRAVLAQF